MATKKVLIIQGHPDKESYCYALAEAYKKGAAISGAEIKHINVAELKFNPNLEFGYRKRTSLETCLIEAQEAIKWADHLVFIHPVWWGSVPALLKGFIDRVFLPGFAFKKRENSLWWDKFLAGRSARIIATLDQPAWYYKLVYRQPSNNALGKLTLRFCGIKPVKTTNIGPIRLSDETFRLKWLARIERLGKNLI